MPSTAAQRALSSLRLEPDPDQARVLEHGYGAILVEGGPGTGKTWSLKERFARLVEAGEDPERVVLFTLTRRAAREAREWLIHRLARSLGDLPVVTVHGFAFRVVARRFPELDYGEPPVVLSAPEQYGAVRDMLVVERPEDWPAFGPLLGVGRFARDLADLMLRAQERLLDPEALAKMVDRSGPPEYREVAAFYQRYLDGLAHSGQVDFAGLLFQTVSLLRSGMTDAERFRHVLVDDYQDATPATEAIVAALGAEAQSVVVAADPAGHVLGYRGGSREPLERAGVALGARGPIRLTRSHRLGERLRALDGLVSREAPPPPAGMEARVLAHPGEEVEAAAHELLRARVDEDVPWGEMAVILRRYGPYLTALRHALARHGIPWVVVAESAELPAEPAVRPVVDLIRYVFRPGRREELLEPLLTSPVVGLDPHGLRRLRRAARLRDVSLRALVEEGAGGELPEDLAPAVRSFRTLLRDLPRFAAGTPPDAVFFELWRRLPHFAALVAGSGEDARGRDLDALAAFSDVLSRFAERRRNATIEDFLEALDAAEFGPDPWLPPEERHPNAVRIVSAHLAQGMEFDTVVVAGCLEGEFPSLHGAEPTIALDRVDRPRPARERLAQRLEEERALFRLAVSRANRTTVLFSSRSTGARSPRTPSRFVARLGLTWTPAQPLADRATSLRSMEAELRRALADQGAEPVRRLAALATLARVGARPDRWWGRRHWTDLGIPLYQGDIRTSYSRLSTMDNCALQYLYSIEMGLDPETTYQMWLGTLVHGIIDEVQRGELDADLGAIHAALDARWRKEVFPNRAVEHRRYLDARDMLQRWLENEQRDVERSEVWFEFPIDGAVVRGRIDAIFRQQNGHLRVVDYKTGRSYPTEEEAKRDLQLAAYYLALKRSPELAGLGPPGVLQLAYLSRAHGSHGFVRRQVSPKTIEGYDRWAEERMLELLGQVRAEDYAPSPQADCQFCEFKTICPRWPEGEEVPVGPAPARGKKEP